MPHLIGKFYFTIIISCLALAAGGCDFRDSGEDIPPDASVEAQALPAATDEPKPTLPNEIAEPISPISSISPIERPTMSQQNVEPIKGSEEALAAAIADLSEQIGVPVDQIILVSMEAIEWSDTSLGCPQEGYMYAQVITPGYLIVLAAQGQQYEYHTDQAINVVLCEE